MLKHITTALALMVTATSTRAETVTMSTYTNNIQEQPHTLICSCDISVETRQTLDSRCSVGAAANSLLFAIPEHIADSWLEGLTHHQKNFIKEDMRRDPHLYFEATLAAASSFAKARAIAKYQSEGIGTRPACHRESLKNINPLKLPLPALATISRARLYAIDKYGLEIPEEEAKQYLQWSAAHPPQLQELAHNLYATAWTGISNQYIDPDLQEQSPKPLSEMEKKTLRDAQDFIDFMIPESPQ